MFKFLSLKPHFRSLLELHVHLNLNVYVCAKCIPNARFQLVYTWRHIVSLYITVPKAILRY